jgi:hypothetical protein
MPMVTSSATILSMFVQKQHGSPNHADATLAWNCKSRCNICLTLRSEMPNAMAYFIAEWRGLVTTARLTVSLFSGVRSVCAPPGSFFYSAEPVDLKFVSHSKITFLLGTLPWWHTLKRTCKRRWVGNRGTSFKKTSNWWKHGVWQSTVPCLLKWHTSSCWKSVSPLYLHHHHPK